MLVTLTVRRVCLLRITSSAKPALVKIMPRIVELNCDRPGLTAGLDLGRLRNFVIINYLVSVLITAYHKGYSLGNPFTT